MRIDPYFIVLSINEGILDNLTSNLASDDAHRETKNVKPLMTDTYALLESLVHGAFQTQEHILRRIYAHQYYAPNGSGYG